MSLDLEHVLVSSPLELTTAVEGEETIFRVTRQGSFQVHHPGRFRRYVRASVVRHYWNPAIPGEPGPFRPVSSPLHLNVTLTILAPDGTPFTADEVTIEDLRRYRDIRGVPTGSWSYTLGGELRHNISEATRETVGEASGEMILWVVESVPSASAPPLIYSTALDGTTQSFVFDLWRQGTLVAEIANGSGWNGTMRLLDPDGVAVATTSSDRLTYDVGPTALRKSRDSSAHAREWSIQARAQGGTVSGSPTISAHVFGSSRVTKSVIGDRLLKLLGENGHFLQIFGRNKNDRAEARLIVDDETAAEAFERFHLVEKALERYDQDPPLVPTDIVKGAEYTLYSMDETPKYGIRLDVGSLKVSAIRVSLGAGEHLGQIPTVTVKIDVEGEALAELGGKTVGRAHVEDGTFQMEVGLELGPDGVPRVATWVQDDVIDGHVDEVTLALVAAALPAGVLVAAAALGLSEYFEHELNEKIVHSGEFLFGHPELASRILMMVMGAHLTYTRIGLDGDDFVFDYVAPLEADPKPRDAYIGVVGRQVEAFGDGLIRLRPRRLDDSWVADNLKTKIKHIVYVMMENRSYDHVLGYRARDPLNEPSDGLTPAVVAAIEGDPQEYTVRNLAQADFPANQHGMMTRLPKGVGHSYVHVTKQLSVKVPGPGGGMINGAKGFVEDFLSYVGKDDLNTPHDERMGVVPNDVLGYYDGSQLPMYEYLARNYAYCDRFFSSHPGPTLPNRMFSLTGDLQYDRVGVPILENNSGDNILLSRAQTIFDVLERRGVSWRIYESVPSVTMLRMFARYAGNADRIRPIETLEDDLTANGLPDFCVIEPAMHHHPQDDDHPDADMWRGQQFIRRVYQALRALPTWNETLLIITYDEHGGFYDHVIPPLADILDAGVGGVNVGGGLMVEGERAEQPDDDEPEGGSGSGSGSGWGGRLGAERFGPGDEGATEVATGDETAPVPPPARRVDIPYGVRVPTFLVSPWVPAGKGPSEVYDFCSILKTVLARFTDDKPFMSDRVAASRSLEAYLSEAAAREVTEEPPEIAQLDDFVRRPAPDESAIATPPLSGRQMREGPVESHDIMGFVARTLGR